MDSVATDAGLIRKLLPVEAAAYRDHLLRLDPDSRRSRFGGAVSDAMIRAFAETPWAADTVLYGFFVDGVLRGVGDLRSFGPNQRDEAEAAFSVEKPWQGRGVGTALLERCLLVARNRGVRLLHVSCLSENQRMQQLARKFDADLRFDFGTVTGRVRNPFPTPFSVWRELVSDGQGLAAACFDFQARMIRQSVAPRSD